jgi:general secretion pathway protein J
VDFAAFSHRRIERDARESDQAELGYFVVRDPVVHGKYDLVRREQTPIDLEPQKGGIVQILAEDIETFELRYLDATTAQWTDNWDSTRTTGQPARIPLAVHIRLVLKGVPNGKPYVFVTKVMLPIQRPLSFGIPR